jgi:hypothetical protein
VPTFAGAALGGVGEAFIVFAVLLWECEPRRL